MAEKEATSKTDDSPPQPSFVEVVCKSSGKVRRFAAGTDAGFALNIINKKLNHDVNENENGSSSSSSLPLASHIEAVKIGHDSEEPISFGPKAILFNHAPPWILQTVVTSNIKGIGKGDNVHKARRHSSAAKGSRVSQSAEKTSHPLSLSYIGKIVLAFLMIFVIGAILTLALENLPTLLLYMNSNM